MEAILAVARFAPVICGVRNSFILSCNLWVFSLLNLQLIGIVSFTLWGKSNF